VELGPQHGFEVTATKDGRLFTKENIAKYDAFFFYTTGDPTAEGGDKQPPMSREGKQALLEAIAGGKGFLGSHCAIDTFHTPGQPFENQDEEKRDPYIRMIGGEFIRHGPQQEAVMRVASPHFPGCEGLEPSFRVNEEWYSNKNFSPDIHVILVQETEGMKGHEYQRPPYPATWARRHQKGRVFYTSLGHREDVWESQRFQKLLLGGVSWVLGRVETDLKPNLAAATPEAQKLPSIPKKGE
jgi:type 1 glutamine amidotransferase